MARPWWSHKELYRGPNGKLGVRVSARGYAEREAKRMLRADALGTITDPTTGRFRGQRAGRGIAGYPENR